MLLTKIASRLLCDILLWLAGPLVFLYCYITLFFMPATAIAPHLHLVTLAFLLLIALRLSLVSLFGNKKIVHFGTAVLLSGMLSSMWIYYAAVLGGLQSWGHVISWELITSYVHQLPALMSVLEMPFIPVLVAAIIVYLLFAMAVWYYLIKFDWIHLLPPVFNAKMRVVLTVFTFSLVSLQIFSYFNDPPVKLSEPVSRTLFPGFAAMALQENKIDRQKSEQLDQVEMLARKEYQISASAKPKNVFLIVVDALRTDKMGVFNYSRETTPYLSQLKKQGHVNLVQDMRAVCTESSCGLLGISASKYVHQFSMQPISLQEILKLHGYSIHMLLSGDHTNFYGLKKVYGNIDSFFDGSMAQGRYPNDDDLVIEKIAQLPNWDKKPLMLQMHLMSSHVISKTHRKQVFQPSSSYLLSKNQQPEKDGTANQAAINFYDNGVLGTDEVIQSILELLKRKSYLEDSIVIITADHGELLGEHGLYTHSKTPFEPALRIPFVMATFGFEAKPWSSAHPSPSQVDIAPTILTELGINIPKTWTGQALQEDSKTSNTFFRQAGDKGLVDSSKSPVIWKYWMNINTGKEYVYQLDKDPQELKNLASEIPSAQKRLWQQTLRSQ
ncbi:sulfatase-like hydrolase/transferase [Undibacterium sp. Di27W]|uniref:sulfatase-like hydrolase/transferase n=1 Tax=Undibacterium sp. Di27W TaxID=3413036 RepID=UPI003BF1796C